MISADKLTCAVWASIKASTFAKEIGLPVGNLWEPGMQRKLEKDCEDMGYESTEEKWRIRLGLN